MGLVGGQLASRGSRGDTMCGGTRTLLITSPLLTKARSVIIHRAFSSTPKDLPLRGALATAKGHAQLPKMRG